MTPRRKSDAGAIEQFLDELPRELRLDARRAAWTRYIYRFDDIRATAAILRGGTLLSRARCQRERLIIHDAANQGIIDQSPHAHEFVRLFFRPRTPTQYKMEGVRPRRVREQNRASCPVPVFLLFDSKELLSRVGVEFTDGGMARRWEYTKGDSAEFLSRIPFESVYHDGPFPREDRDEIVFRRHAEVLVRDSLELDALRHVVCRTGPERDTLLHLLGDQVARWQPIIRLERPGEALFDRLGAYVEGVVLLGDELLVHTPVRLGPFALRMRVEDAATGELLFERDGELPSIGKTSRAVLSRAAPRVSVHLELEDGLAFEGVVSRDVVLGG